MKIYFKDALPAIREDAIKRFPEECCGLVVEGKYIPCDNIAKKPKKDFKISSEEYAYYYKKYGIEAIVHSHSNFPHASKQDIVQQIATGVPWGIVNMKKRTIMNIFFWGDQLPIQEMIGRPFHYGVYDCYTLGRDYMREKGIVLPQFPSEWEWWKKGQNLYLDHLKKAGFKFIGRSELKEGDGILFKIMSKVTNHSAVYLGNGLIMHHLINRLSKREPVARWMKYATHYVRYVG